MQPYKIKHQCHVELATCFLFSVPTVLKYNLVFVPVLCNQPSLFLCGTANPLFLLTV